MRALVILILLATSAHADGIWQGKDYRRDATVHVSGPVLSIKTDMESGEVIARSEQDTTVYSCVEYNGEECKPSYHFVATVTDVKG